MKNKSVSIFAKKGGSDHMPSQPFVRIDTIMDDSVADSDEVFSTLYDPDHIR